MKIKTWIKFEESFLPPRCRKLRYKECEEYVDIELKETTMNALKLAFIVNTFDGCSIYAFDNKLWKKAAIRDICAGGEDEYGYHTPLQALEWWNQHGSCYFRFDFDREHYGKDTSREAVIDCANNDIGKYILVDGELFVQTYEPMYCIYTFGLGHNHGGTSLSVDNHYNCNISSDRYYSALEYDKAIKEVIRVAESRGDTKDVERYQELVSKPIINVILPECVHRNPELEHGTGNEVLNDFENVIKSSASSVEAGLLCIAMAAIQ